MRQPADSDHALAAAEALEGVTAWLRRAVRPAGWNAVALSTLVAVERNGPVRVGDLAQQERLSQPGMTGLVARLAAAGLVAKHGDPADGRATLVEITPAGSRYLASLRRQRARTVAGHLATLPEQERQALLAAVPALHTLAGIPLEGAP